MAGEDDHVADSCSRRRPAGDGQVEAVDAGCTHQPSVFKGPAVAVELHQPPVSLLPRGIGVLSKGDGGRPAQHIQLFGGDGPYLYSHRPRVRQEEPTVF